MTDVLITGAAGKMGSLSAATIAAQDDLTVVALVDPKGGASAGGAPCFTSVAEALARTSPQAALEFSVPTAVFANTRTLLEAGVPTVVGTTGLSDEEVEVLRSAAAARDVGLVIVPNFALGAILLMRFARQAAKYYEQAEVIELHGAGKLDAPSGTSLRTARLMAEEPGSALREPPAAVQPARGHAADRVRIHSVRLPGLVAHQEVLFGGIDELLTLRHDSFSRRSFMSGVLLALRRVVDLRETIVGLENVLD
jgi:4-hydroxy-tetrahydrodipicolinate reductase